MCDILCYQEPFSGATRDFILSFPEVQTKVFGGILEMFSDGYIFSTVFLYYRLSIAFSKS